MTTRPFSVAKVDLHPGIQMVGEQFLQFEDPGRPEPGGAVGRRSGRRAAELIAVTDRFLHSPNRELLGDGPACQGLLKRPIGCTEQRSGVPGAELCLR